MRLAIMQPYFFPNIGYFELMAAVGKIVLLDDVHFINRGWINRNRIAIKGQPHWLTREGRVGQERIVHICAREGATTYLGLPEVQRKAYLAPLAHDERPMYFDKWDRFFSLPRSLIFNGTAESRLARAIPKPVRRRFCAS